MSNTTTYPSKGDPKAYDGMATLRKHTRKCKRCNHTGVYMVAMNAEDREVSIIWCYYCDYPGETVKVAT